MESEQDSMKTLSGAAGKGSGSSMSEAKKQQYMWPSRWSKPSAHGDCGAVSCNNIYATRAGLEMLRAGGNAFDAAVAVSLTLSVVEPHHSGIGGGCFSLLYSQRDQKVLALDARGVAPAKAGEDLFLKDGEVQDEWKDLGGQSVAIPGLLRAMETLLREYGTLTLAQAAAPAIRCAREGFGTSYTGELTMEDDSVRRKLDLSPQFRRLYLKPDGSRYRFGEKQVNSELAGLLELVAAEGADAFYTGPVARKMVEQINQRGGCFTLEDLSRYQPKYRTPVKTTYRGLEVAAFAPPSGGCAVVEMLNILEHSDLAAMGHNTAASIHAIAELDSVLPETDLLVMALPSTAETAGILSRERIALLPDSAFVVNVGRGTAIDQEALCDALNAGQLAGAALDVVVPEPLPADHPLRRAKNLLLTPHVAGNMTLGYTCDKSVQMFCDDLENYAAGRPLAHLVDRKRGY